jgi:hypothetical protein
MSLTMVMGMMPASVISRRSSSSSSSSAGADHDRRAMFAREPLVELDEVLVASWPPGVPRSVM